MKVIYRVLFYVVTSTASALPLVRPALPPPSSYADTESVTNVAFNAGVPGDNVFSLSLALDASPSNNVEVAFGCDANARASRKSRKSIYFAVLTNLRDTWILHPISLLVGNNDRTGVLVTQEELNEANGNNERAAHSTRDCFTFERKMT